MADRKRESQSLREFLRASGHSMKQLSKTKRPVFLTVRGETVAIIQDAKAYQKILDIVAQADSSTPVVRK